MVRAWLQRQPKGATEKGGAEFSNEFLDGVGGAAEAASQVTIEAGWMTTPVAIMPISA